MMQMPPRQHCEERIARRAGVIAYTVTKLNLTAEQRPLWDKVQGPLQQAADATAQLQALTRRFRRSRTIVFDETLSATGSGGQQSRFTAVAPHRLAYVIRGGPSAIVIGGRRWDRDRPGQPYVESPQTPIDVTAPSWTSASNVHEIAPGVLTFLDRRLPAWFRVTLANRLPRVVRMTAPAHFMTERYVGFDVPAVVSPPSR